MYLHQLIISVIVSIDDEERKQHYEEIKNDLNIAEDNMDSLVSGKLNPCNIKLYYTHGALYIVKCISF